MFSLVFLYGRYHVIVLIQPSSRGLLLCFCIHLIILVDVLVLIHLEVGQLLLDSFLVVLMVLFHVLLNILVGLKLNNFFSHNLRHCFFALPIVRPFIRILLLIMELLTAESALVMRLPALRLVLLNHNR